jgi:hypothetical protein
VIHFGFPPPLLISLLSPHQLSTLLKTGIKSRLVGGVSCFSWISHFYDLASKLKVLPFPSVKFTAETVVEDELRIAGVTLSHDRWFSRQQP